MKIIRQTAFISLILILVGCAGSKIQGFNPNNDYPWVIRTDFSNDNEWDAVCKRIAVPQYLFGMKAYAYVQYINDKQFSGLKCEDVVYRLPDNYPEFTCFIVDNITLSDDENPILVVYFAPNSVEIEDYKRPPRKTPFTDIKTFRAIPSKIQSIQNNLSIANMDFEDYSESVDGDGIFRGFSR